MIGRPDFDPTVYQFPPSSSTWRHAAWNFYPAPPALTQGFGIWNGLSSECMGCSVAKMFSIGPANPARFVMGLCQGNNVFPNGRWDQVVMGRQSSPAKTTARAAPSARYNIQRTIRGAAITTTAASDTKYIRPTIRIARSRESISAEARTSAVGYQRRAGVAKCLAAATTRAVLGHSELVDEQRTGGGSGPDADGLMHSFPPNGVATFDHTTNESTPAGGGLYDSEYDAYWTLPDGGTLVTSYQLL